MGRGIIEFLLLFFLISFDVEVRLVLTFGGAIEEEEEEVVDVVDVDLVFDFATFLALGTTVPKALLFFPFFFELFA